MKKFWMTLLLLICSPIALATLIMSEPFTGPGGVTVNVESTVTEMSGGGYLYTYQIKDIGDLNIATFSVPFSIPLLKPSEIYGFDSDAPLPLPYWNVMGSPAEAAYAFFAPIPLTDGSSPVLSFKSMYGAEVIQGNVNDVQLGSLYGNLFAPVPEPLTISLLVIGAGIIVRKKR